MPKKEHPFQIGIATNPAMHCFDIQVSVGNFKTEQEAKEYADRLLEFLKENTNNFWAQRVQ